MNEIFRLSDTYRQSVELEAAHEREVKDELIRDSENKLIARFLNIFGGGKIAESSKDELTKVEGKTSSDVIFDGTITVNAEVIDHKGTKRVAVAIPVKGNEIDLLSDDELKKLVADAETHQLAEEITEVVSAFPVKANLSQFRVCDDGSDYLKVYHVALDTGKELGIIGKDEYNSLQDKELFFKEALKNQIRNSVLENHYELSFEGEFVEPTIETVSVENIVTAADYEKKEHVTKTAAAEEIVEEDKDNIFLGHQADIFEQSIQFETQKTQTDIDRVATKVANDLIVHLRALKYDSVKLLAVDSAEEASVKVTASLSDSVGDKIVTFVIPVRDEAYTLPKKEAVAQLVSSVEDLQSKIAASFAEEALARMKEIDEAEEWKERETEAAVNDGKIEKTAGGDVGGVQTIGPVDVLQIEKHSLGLPDDTEIGYEIFADGFHWKLVNKDQNNLSKEADSGSIWTFHKIPPTDKKPETEVIA